MTGKKSRLLVLWLACALLLLGACGQKPAEPAETGAPGTAAEPAPEASAEPSPEVSPEPAPEAEGEPAPESAPELPGTAELLQVCGGENGERCLAAGADGTRFLIAAQNAAAWDLWVQNADGSGRKSLYTGLAEEEAENLIRFCGIPQEIIRMKEDQVLKWISSQRSQYGSYANALVHLVFRSPSPQNIRVAGNFALLTDYNAGVSARINMQTGETVLLPRMTALMLRDGTVLCVSSDAYRSEDPAAVPAFWLRPDQAVPEEADYPALRGVSSLQGCFLQEDRTIWMLVPGEMETVETDGRKEFYRSFSVVHLDEGGTVLRRIDGGRFNMSFTPSFLLYSEQAGAGVVYSNQYHGGDLWFFGPDSDVLKPLVPETILPPSLRVGEREDVLDEAGRPTDASRPLYVFGLSEGGTKLLVQDLATNYVLSLDLRTLKADILMDYGQIMSFTEGRSDRPSTLLTYAGWNGREILSCGREIGGCAIRLPFRESD